MFIRFAVLVALLAPASAGTGPAPADVQGGPIKIGLLVPLSGAASALSPEGRGCQKPSPPSGERVG